MPPWGSRRGGRPSAPGACSGWGASTSSLRQSVLSTAGPTRSRQPSRLLLSQLPDGSARNVSVPAPRIHVKSLPDSGKAHEVPSSGQQIFIIVFLKNGQLQRRPGPSSPGLQPGHQQGARRSASPSSELLQSKYRLRPSREGVTTTRAGRRQPRTQGPVSWDGRCPRRGRKHSSSRGEGR